MSVLVTAPDTLLGFSIARALAGAGIPGRLLVPEGSLLPDDPPEGAVLSTVSSASLDVESCLAALDGVTAVFHCESARLSGDPGDRPAGRLFLEGTRNLLIAMRRAGVEDLYHAGTALAFRPGTLQEPGDETDEWDEPPPLACLEAQRAARDLISRQCDDGTLKCVTFCPALLAGRGDGPGGAAWRLLEDVLRGVAPGAGGINLARAADAAEAAVKALGRAKPGASYILGGENVDYADLLAHAVRALGLEGLPEVKARRRKGSKRRGGDGKALLSEAGLRDTGLYYSPRLARDDLGLNVSPAAVTVAEAAQWYLERSGRAGGP